ncbi:MAG: oligosaccharide flippase family protein [Anaerolineaceae bacterium]|nr:oligosaccharide flippase family protein [Anaerolineaceae bacterium]
MLIHLRRLSAQTAIYGLGGIATSLASFLLLPIYTHILPPGEYGKIAVVTLMSTVLAVFLDSGLKSAFFRFYFLAETLDEKHELTGTVFIYLLLSAAVILAPLLIFFNPIAQFLFQDTSIFPFIRIAIIGTYFDVVSGIPFAIFRAEQRATPYAILSVLRVVINLTINILAVVVFHLGVAGVIYANLITSILFFLICSGLTLGSVKWTINFDLLKKLLRFGLPLVPAALATWGLALSDRFFLQRYADISVVGVYAVGYSIANIVSIITNWFNTAYAPYCYSLYNQPNAKSIYIRMLSYAITLFSFVGLGISLFAQQILAFLSKPAYHDAASVVPLIVLSYLLYEVNYMITFGLDLTRKTGRYSFIVGSAAVFNLLLNILLIPRYGMMGAAVATALSYAVLLIVGYSVVQQVYPVSYEWPRLLKLALITAGIYFINVATKTGQFWVDGGIGLLLLLCWFLALYILGYFTQNEINTARFATQKGISEVHIRFQHLFSKIRWF